MIPSSAPLVTVVIPVYDGALYLGEAIESVLAQTYRPVEVVVVDDGSTDSTPAVAQRFGDAVRYTCQDNAGPAAAMNRGLGLAAGDYIAFLSADDLWVPEKLAWQMAAAVPEGEADLVFGHVLHFLSPELTEDVARTLRCPPDPMPARSAGTLLARLATFRRVGLFDERWRTGEFFDWYGRAADLGLQAHILAQVVSRRRVHAANHSYRSRAPQTGYAKVLKATLDRRRQGHDLPDAAPPCA